MKNAVYAILLGLCLLAAMPAAAFETPVKSEKGKAILQKMGTDLAPIAARFGCPDFAWAAFVDQGRVAAFEYVPKGVDVKKWERMTSMAVYALPGKAAEDKKAMTALAMNLLGGYKKNGKVLKSETFHNKQDEPGLFVEYTIGEGKAKEHSAGVFMRLTAHTAAFVQLQSRGKALSAEDSAKIRSMIGAPAPKKG